MENLKKFSLRDRILMALALALMIVVGRLLYSISLALPIPSSRVLVTAPVFAFIYAATAMVTRRIGTVTIISIAYGLYMMRITVFGALAGVLSGILADIITFIIFRNYDKNENIVYSVPIRSSISVWTSFFIVKFFVPNSKFIQAGFIPTAVVCVVIYFIGYFVSKYTVEILSKRLAL